MGTTEGTGLRLIGREVPAHEAGRPRPFPVQNLSCGSPCAVLGYSVVVQKTPLIPLVLE